MSPTSLEDLKSGRFYLALFAELLGTLILVLVACGSCAKTATVVQIALAFGLSVASMVWVIGHVSGGHINPGVTIGFLVTRKISIVRGLLYIVVQTVGAIAGAYLLQVASPVGWNDMLGTPAPVNGLSTGQAFFIELIITFILELTVFATCDALRTGFEGSGPLAIGLSLTMCHLWAVPYDGSGMNPARAFGPALASGYLNDHAGTHFLVYWLGPLVGGILAGLLYDLLLATNASPQKVKALLTRRDYDDSQFDETGQSTAAAA